MYVKPFFRIWFRIKFFGSRRSLHSLQDDERGIRQLQSSFQDAERGIRQLQSSFQDDECGILQLKSVCQDGCANAVGCAATQEACFKERHSRPSEARKGIHNQRSIFLLRESKNTSGMMCVDPVGRYTPSRMTSVEYDSCRDSSRMTGVEVFSCGRLCILRLRRGLQFQQIQNS